MHPFNCKTSANRLTFRFQSSNTISLVFIVIFSLSRLFINISLAQNYFTDNEFTEKLTESNKKKLNKYYSIYLIAKQLDDESIKLFAEMKQYEIAAENAKTTRQREEILKEAATIKKDSEKKAGKAEKKYEKISEKIYLFLKRELEPNFIKQNKKTIEEADKLFTTAKNIRKKSKSITEIQNARNKEFFAINIIYQLIKNPDNNIFSENSRKKTKPLQTINISELNSRTTINSNNTTIYRLQLKQSTKMLTEAEIVKLYTGKEVVFIEEDESGYRYCIGAFQSLKKAQDYANETETDAIIISNKSGTLTEISPEQEKEIVTTEKNDEIIFRVQIVATTKQTSEDKLRQLVHNNEQIFIDISDGWFRYMIGNFSNYDEAEILRKSLKIADAFIVAYINGVRTLPNSDQ